MDRQHSQSGRGDKYDRLCYWHARNFGDSTCCHILTEIFRLIELKLVSLTTILQLRILVVYNIEWETKFNAE